MNPEGTENVETAGSIETVGAVVSSPALSLNININISITREQAPRTHQWLASIARRVESIEAAAEEKQITLSDARILNRLHSLGVNAYQQDLEAARSVNAHNRESGLNLREAAEMIGVEMNTLQEWIAKPEAQDGMPPLTEVYRSEGGRVASYDYFDILLLRRWVEARKGA